MSAEPTNSPLFPPLAWLGYGLNLTRFDPFSFSSVFSSKTDVRIIDITKDTKTRTVVIGGVEYHDIPRVVSASDTGSAHGAERTFEDGALAVRDVQSNASLAYDLFPVTTNNISHFPLNKSLPTKNQFLFFYNNHEVYSANLSDYFDFINEDELLKFVSKLPDFDSENAQSVQAYTEFFGAVGSHFISTTTFGARFQLEVWALNKFSDVNSNFRQNVTASVRGLNNGGDYDRDIIDQPQYKNFERLSQRVIRIRGGDSHLADAVLQSPNPTTFASWTDSIASNSELVTFRASELWTILRGATNEKLEERAPHIQRAFEYISSIPAGLPNDKHTWVTFEASSQFAEFGILTPSTVVGGGDGNLDALPKAAALGPAKVNRVTQVPSVFTAVVDIVSDGTPIDIYVSSQAGRAVVNILGNVYETEGGTRWYNGVPVSV